MPMRPVLLLLIAAAGGCTSLGGSRPTRWLNQMNPFSDGGDQTLLRVYLLDQPAGDPYLTHELWTKTLKPLSAEKQALLLENGLRVGHLTGNPPYQFLTLSRTPDAVLKPMQYTVTASDALPLPLNTMAEAEFEAFVEIGAKPGQFKLKDAEAAMNVTAVAAENGKVKLTLEPRLQHGGRILGWKPTVDATAFTWLDQKTQERFPSLKFEITLAPEEYLVIGPSQTPANTLGGASFVNVGGTTARMRVLVVQAAPLQKAAASGKKAPAVIAAQASAPISRGQRP